MERLLTVREVFEQTGIPEGTWRYWRHLGMGPNFQRIGRRLRVRESDLSEWLKTQFNDADVER